ncbi:hypothetical protein C9374_013117 [Naegleria lovaniensis]|uniref:Protein kinase domain-containing protein n=1 Tax=Naegleria lovaniensis TaxID=51637 RepID=A0AA88GBZ1_NAELO|nr:uncharacterized protein C9374_013117 [Naegleria lovaniensis]KAG2372837.1 hypothetical protein C9374_013117 [Naegleria lovaniensis]
MFLYFSFQRRLNNQSLSWITLLLVALITCYTLFLYTTIAATTQQKSLHQNTLISFGELNQRLQLPLGDGIVGIECFHEDDHSMFSKEDDHDTSRRSSSTEHTPSSNFQTVIVIHTVKNRIITLSKSNNHKEGNDETMSWHVKMYEQMKEWSDGEEKSIKAIFKRKLDKLDHLDENQAETSQKKSASRYLVRMASPFSVKKAATITASKFGSEVGPLFIIDKLLDEFLMWNNNQEEPTSRIPLLNETMATLFKGNIADFQFNGNLAVWLTTLGHVYYSFISNVEQFWQPSTQNCEIYKALYNNREFKARKIALGTDHLLIIGAHDNGLYSLGGNDYGQAGLSQSHAIVLSLSRPDGIKGKIKDVSVGKYFSIVLTDNHQIYTFGINENGQVALNPSSTSKSHIPTPITSKLFGDEKIATIATGSAHTAVLTESGSIFTWGSNSHKQLLHNSTHSHIPTMIFSNIRENFKLSTSLQQVFACGNNLLLLLRDFNVDSLNQQDIPLIDLNTMSAINNSPSKTELTTRHDSKDFQTYEEKNQYILENFEFVEQVGSGAEGLIHKYKCKTTQEHVVIKHMKVSENEKASFQAHIEQVRKLNHKHLVPYLDAFCDEKEEKSETFYCHIIMPYYYQDLSDLIFYHSDMEHDATTITDVYEIGYQIAEGIDYLHQLDLVHRDVKVENILIESCGGKHKFAKITDYGFMTNINQVHSTHAYSEDVGSLNQNLVDSFNKKRSAMYIGSLPTVAPEIKTKSHISKDSLKATDSFSFGVLLYQLLIFKSKITLDGVEHYISDALLYDERAAHQEITKQLSLKPYPKLCIDLALSLLQKDWTKRPTMREVKNVLDYLSRGEKWSFQG